MRQVKNYTAHEKAKVALAAMHGELTYAQLSTKYNVHSSQIKRWKAQLKEGLLDIFSSPRKKKAQKLQAELIEQLYQQVGQLTIERDWLKKKSELFS